MMTFRKLFGVIVTLFSAAHGDHYFDEYVLPSSCVNLDNGEHQLKHTDGDVEDFPVVTLQCSNGYTILDVSKDSLESYFNTFMKFYRAAAGPSNEVQPNWEGWYLGDDGRSEYVISPDCDTCNVDHVRQLYITDDLHKTAYMMIGTMFGCFWNSKGEHNFDEDYDSYQCYYTTGEINAVGESIRSELNDYSTENEWDMSGVCGFRLRASDRSVKDVVKHDLCTSDYISLNNAYETDYGDSDVYYLKPSIGTDEKLVNIINNNDDKNDKKNNVPSQKISVTQLYPSDFESDTYRIKTSGIYKIMKDMIFDFNANYDSLNSVKVWWPHEDQSDEYLSAGDYHDLYNFF